MGWSDLSDRVSLNSGLFSVVQLEPVLATTPMWSIDRLELQLTIDKIKATSKPLNNLPLD